MRLLLSLAWKNLSRYRKRTMITASALAVGLGIYLLMDSMLLGAELESERNLVWYESSSARIMKTGYWEDREQLPLKHVIEAPDAVQDLLREQGVASAPRVVFGGELVVMRDPFPEDGSLRVKVYGIDPQVDDDVFRFRETVVSGRYLQPDEDGVMLGSWLAEDLGAEVGYPTTIVTRTRDGYYQTIDAEVVGIVACPNPLVNRSSVFIPLQTADYYLEMQGAVTEINLRFPETHDADERAAELQVTLSESLPDLQVMSWRRLASSYVALAKQKQQGSGVIMFLVFVIAAVGISNTMLMAIYERTKELGTMRALGMKDSEVRLTFVMEAAGIGLIGSAMGVALGTLLCLWIVNTGIDYSSIIREMDIGYRIAGVFRGAWHPQAMVQAFFAGVLIAVVVSLVPTRRALRMQITDCLREK
jgi:ABC-type lipoprotein release transport system permease subunit